MIKVVIVCDKCGKSSQPIDFYSMGKCIPIKTQEHTRTGWHRDKYSRHFCGQLCHLEYYKRPGYEKGK